MTRASPFRPSVLSDERRADPLTRVETSCQRETCTGHFTARSKDEPSPSLGRRGGGGGGCEPRKFFPNRRPVNCLPSVPRDSPGQFPGWISWTFSAYSSSWDTTGRARTEGGGRGAGGGRAGLLSSECHTCCQRIPRQIDFRPRRAPRPSTRPPPPPPPPPTLPTPAVHPKTILSPLPSSPAAPLSSRRDSEAPAGDAERTTTPLLLAAAKLVNRVS